jgi:trimeric autotransporter adhesin
MKRLSSFVILILLFLTLLTACPPSGDDIGIPPGQPATLISIAVTPADPSIALGTTTLLTAIGTYSNNSRQNITSSVVWDSSDITIATISNDPGSQGLVTATTSTIGTVLITATSSGITGSTTLTTSHVGTMNVAPPTPSSIAPTTSMQFIAAGTLSGGTSTQNLTAFATWSSSDPTVADVSDTAGSKGLTIAVNPGTATITAIYDGQSGTALFSSSMLTSITIDPPSASIAKGTTQQFTATGHLADGAQQILTTVATWSSSTTGIATFNNAAVPRGLATAVSAGTTTILASFSIITSSPATLTVTPALLSSISVTPVNPSIVLGTTQQFAAIGTFSDTTTQNITSSVTWNSSNATIATISSNGLATTVAAGSTTISATSGGISGSTTLTVTPIVLESIEVTPATSTILTASGILNQQFTAIGHFSDNSTQDLTTFVLWNSSTNVANISNTTGFQGLATISFIIGTTNITAAFSGITSNPATLTVTN